MFKKTADLTHFHERTGSHATKGTGRGTVWWKTADPENFSRRELAAEKGRMIKQYRDAMAQFHIVIGLHREAVERGSDPLATKQLVMSMRTFSQNLRQAKIDLDQIKCLLRDHAKPLKLRKLKNVLTKRRTSTKG